jgi:S1-C subfamily serine protease
MEHQHYFKRSRRSARRGVEGASAVFALLFIILLGGGQVGCAGGENGGKGPDSDPGVNGKSDAFSECAVYKGELKYPVVGYFDDSSHHVYNLTVAADVTVDISLRSNGESTLDTVLRVYGPRNDAGGLPETKIAYDDDGGESDLSSRITGLQLATGIYGIVASTHGGQAAPGQSYRLEASCVLGDCKRFSSMGEALGESNENVERYSGVVSFARAGTGFVLETHGQEDSPAYVLTNGHCIDSYMSPREIRVDQEPTTHRDAVFFFEFAASEPPQHQTRTIAVSKIAYATMKGTDIALCELDATYGQIVGEWGIKAWEIDPRPGKAGEPVEVVGIPFVGLDPLAACLSRTTCLHRWACEIEKTVDLREGTMRSATSDSDSFFWYDEYRHNQCHIVVGFSGSPLISLSRGTVVGIANTGAGEAGQLPSPFPGGPVESQKDCSAGRPCEIGKDETSTLVEGSSYSSPVHALAGCFDEQGIFALELPTCGLEKP